MPKILQLVTDGSEDVEFIAPHDIFDRNNIQTDILYITDLDQVILKSGIVLKINTIQDEILNKLSTYDALVIPGGPGIDNIDNWSELDNVLKAFEGKLIAAICAAPSILAKRGLLKGRKAICFNAPEYRDVLINNGVTIESPNCEYGQSCEVVIDGNFITSLGMRSSIAFADAIVNYLNGKNK